MSKRVKHASGAGKLAAASFAPPAAAPEGAKSAPHERTRGLGIAQAFAGLFGLAFYIAAGGLVSLNPTRIDWLQKTNDWSQHYLGWAFGRFSPWTFPFGILPDLGEPVGTRVAYMDANPLLALLLRPIAAFLPDTFQYIGPWMASCMILQGVFGVLLTAAVLPPSRKPDPLYAALGGLLFVAVPTLIHRIDHDTLMAQWLILGALAVALSEQPLPLSQPRVRATVALGLAIFAAAVHPYLLAMILPLCAWGLVRDAHRWRVSAPEDALGHEAATTAALEAPRAPHAARDKKKQAAKKMAEQPPAATQAAELPRIARGDVARTKRTLGAAALTLTGFVMLLALELFAVGYVSREDAAGSDGFGYFCADLTSFYNPMGFSRLLRDIPFHGGQAYEGFGYLGLGALGLVAVALFLELSVKEPIAVLPSLHQKFVATVVVGAAIFGLSSHIFYRGRALFELTEFYRALEPLPAMFRSSGRFVWPLGYALIALSLGLIARMVPRLGALALVALAVAAQLGDLKLPTVRERLNPAPHDELVDQRWEELAHGTKHVVLVPPQFPASISLRCGPWVFPKKWEVAPAIYAAKHHMSTNSVYTARSRPQAVRAACQQALSDMAHGAFRDDALYIVADGVAQALELDKRPLHCFEADGRTGCVHRDHPMADAAFLKPRVAPATSASAAAQAP